MVKDPNTPNGYREEFDILRIREIAEMSKGYVGKGEFKSVPDIHFSDFECNVWEIMNELIRYGRDLNKEEAV